MSYYENDKYDIFIAYYGNETNGTEGKALDLYHQINNAAISANMRVRAYFHPMVNPYGSFEETPMIVARTPLFLLVVDKYIPTNADGQLLKHRENGTLSNLFEEVRSFHDSAMYKSVGGDTAAKVFITDDMDFKSAECLHPVFSGKTALRTPREVLDWIAYFYRNTYTDRLYRKYDRLLKDNQQAFLQGAWVKEAEEAWRATQNERIGRALLIYYKIKSRQGFADARKQVRKLEQEFSSFRYLDPKTADVLKKPY